MIHRNIEYEQLIATLKWNEAQQDREAANKILYRLAEYHRERVAKNDRFVLRCKAGSKGGNDG